MNRSRQAFEAWASAKRFPIQRDKDGYSASTTQMVWEAWKAASIHWAAWVLMTGPAKAAHKAREVLGENDEAT